MCCRGAAEPDSLKQLIKRLRRANRSSASPWPECKRCKLAVDREDMSWLFPHLCDSHGLGKLEAMVRRIVRSYGRRSTVRILKRLAK
jgi:hypothetical protein